jgi:hypothetical protein
MLLGALPDLLEVARETLSGFSELISAENAKSLGIRGILVKQVVLKELSELIRKNAE